MTMTTAIAADDTSTAISPRPIARSPGRSTIMAPAKPTSIAVQRRTRTTSPSRTMAVTVAKIGAVKLSAVASASGTTVMA